MNSGNELLSNRVQDTHTQVLLITSTLNERTQRPANEKTAVIYLKHISFVNSAEHMKAPIMTAAPQSDL